MPNRLNAQSQASDDEVMALLNDIHRQNQGIAKRFDDLEQGITKRAKVAGAMAGACSGGIGGAVVTVGIELIKAKFGG